MVPSSAMQGLLFLVFVHLLQLLLMEKAQGLLLDRRENGMIRIAFPHTLNHNILLLATIYYCCDTERGVQGDRARGAPAAVDPHRRDRQGELCKRGVARLRRRLPSRTQRRHRDARRRPVCRVSQRSGRWRRPRARCARRAARATAHVHAVRSLSCFLACRFSWCIVHAQFIARIAPSDGETLARAVLAELLGQLLMYMRYALELGQQITFFFLDDSP